MIFQVYYIYYIYNNTFYYFNLYVLANESRIEEVKLLTVVSYLNSALCNLKSNRHTHAKNDCDNALSIEPTNVKALFRKGEVIITLVEIFNCIFF